MSAQSDLVNQAYALTPAEIALTWQTAPSRICARAKNEALARLMDAGRLLFGKLEAEQWVGDWLKVEARVYPRDF